MTVAGTYTSYIGRVGALAVALGIGAAVVAFPVSAFADSSGSAGSSGSSSSAGGSDSSGGSSGSGKRVRQGRVLGRSLGRAQVRVRRGLSRRGLKWGQVRQVDQLGCRQACRGLGQVFRSSWFAFGCWCGFRSAGRCAGGRVGVGG